MMCKQARAQSEYRSSVFAASRESEFEQVFDKITEQKLPALLIGDDPFLFSQRDQRCGCRRVTPFRLSLFPVSSPMPAV